MLNTPRAVCRMLPLLALPIVPVAVPAQEVPLPLGTEAVLPAEVTAAVIDFYNDPRRIRLEGPARVPADSVVRGDVAVLEGPFDVAGRVDGSVLVINGDLFLGSGAVLTGDVLVIGGSVDGLTGAEVTGEVAVYPAPLRYRLENGRMLAAPREPRPRPESPPGPTSAGDTVPARDSIPDGGPRLDFLMTTGDSYNRVEGLPITFGPRVRTAGSNPLLLQALAVYRTESGFTSDVDRLGYYVQAQQYFGGRREWSVGATAHSLNTAIEDWHLSDLENGLAAFLFHRDFRDHYEREGFAASLGWEPRGLPLSLGVESRWERHRSLVEGSPLTLFDNAEPWRPQPVVGQGRIGTVGASATLDTRSSTSDPAAGWYARGWVEQAFHVDLSAPALFPPLDGGLAAPLPAREFGRFTRGMLDIRRYNRLSPDVRLNLRGLVGGALSASPLPPQRQHAYGGEGSLPGYSLLSQDCDARAIEYRRRDEPDGASNRAFAHYGCDAFTVVQAELRGKLDFRLRLDSAPWDEEEDVGFGWDIAPDWVIFVDGGTGWSFGDRPEEPFRMDVGAGLLIHRIGLFVAAPLRSGGDFNVFARLGPRF